MVLGQIKRPAAFPKGNRFHSYSNPPDLLSHRKLNRRTTTCSTQIKKITPVGVRRNIQAETVIAERKVRVDDLGALTDWVQNRDREVGQALETERYYRSPISKCFGQRKK